MDAGLGIKELVLFNKAPMAKWNLKMTNDKDTGGNL